MPLRIIPPLNFGETVPAHPARRVYCDGCGVGRSYQPHEWVFSDAQVKDWFEEHKDHAPPADEKKKH